MFELFLNMIIMLNVCSYKLGIGILNSLLKLLKTEKTITAIQAANGCCSVEIECILNLLSLV